MGVQVRFFDWRTPMNPRSTVRIAGHPLHVMLVSFVIAFYFGAFASDLAFTVTLDPFWARAALWLIGAGLVVSLPASTVGLIDFLFEPAIRDIRASWWHLGGNVVVSLISLIDWVLRYEAGAEAGSTSFVWLSFLVVLLLTFTGWKGGEMVYRHRVGVRD
jgi:uncharacterized membrane protein